MGTPYELIKQKDHNGYDTTLEVYEMSNYFSLYIDKQGEDEIIELPNRLSCEDLNKLAVELLVVSSYWDELDLQKVIKEVKNRGSFFKKD